MSLSLRLVFEDGTEREIAGLPWQTVFQAAQAHGIELATDCREGACGTCKARCTEGEYDVGDASPEALTAEEEAAGLVLTCQMLPLGDCRAPLPLSLLADRRPGAEAGRAGGRGARGRGHGPVRACARCGAALPAGPVCAHRRARLGGRARLLLLPPGPGGVPCAPAAGRPDVRTIWRRARSPATGSTCRGPMAGSSCASLCGPS